MTEIYIVLEQIHFSYRKGNCNHKFINSYIEF